MDSDKMPLASGDMVGRRYRVGELLGVGGSAAVVAALDVETGAEVAIKCLLPKHAKRTGVILRLQREAHVGARLRSVHTVRILDYGMIDPVAGAVSGEDSASWTRGSGLPYIVMERVTGIDLSSLWKQRGALDPHMAADYVAQACSALAEAHALGIVHRDIKPQNLLLTCADALPLVKVLDFGIASFTSPNAAGDAEKVTVTGTMLGTPAYMSPEQIAEPSGVDARADIWSLGVTLYRLITGTPPFQGETAMDLALSIIHDEPPPLHTLRADVPPGLDAVVQRCLRKNKGERYENATALQGALASFASSISRSAESHPPPTLRLQGEEPPPAGSPPPQLAEPGARG